MAKGSIEKRGENSWRLRVDLGFNPDGTRNRPSKTITIEDKALLKTTKKLQEYLEDQLAAFKQEVLSGNYIKPEKMTLQQFIENEWLPKYASDPDNLSPLTAKTYQHHIKNHILPVIGNKPLSDIKTIQLVTLINNLKKPGARKDGRGKTLSSYTIVYIYNVLRNLFNMAKEWNLIKDNPMDGVKKPKKEKRKMNPYSADEAREVIKRLSDEPQMWRIFILGSMLGGFRRGELLALEWPDVDFREKCIHIRKSISLVQKGKAFEKGTKNDEDRIVDMPDWYMIELEQYYKAWKRQRWENNDIWQGGDREYLFHNGTGKPLYHTTPTGWWNDFVKRHGIRKIRLHDLRHSSATLLIEAGAHLKAIQERLGHKQFQTTADIYAHVTKKVSRELAEKFNVFDPSANQK
jgi:integrase